MSDLAATNCGGCGGWEITAILLYGLSFSFSSLTEITDVDATMVVEMVAIPSGL